MIRTIVASLTALVTLAASANEYREPSRRGACANSSPILPRRILLSERVPRARCANWATRPPMRFSRSRACSAMRRRSSRRSAAATGGAAIPTISRRPASRPPRRWWRSAPARFSRCWARFAAPTWAARRNAAWALGAFDDQRAVDGAGRGVEGSRTRRSRAGGVGARRIDDKRAVQALIGALKDTDPRVRRQAAWALGAIDDPAAAGPALGGADAKRRTDARAGRVGARRDRRPERRAGADSSARAIRPSACANRPRGRSARSMTTRGGRTRPGAVGPEQRRPPAGSLGARRHRRFAGAARPAAGAQGHRRGREKAGRMGDWRDRKVRVGRCSRIFGMRCGRS